MAMEEIEDPKSVITPKPTGSYVLIENPLYEKIEDLEKELNKLPESEKDEYIKNNISIIWENICALDIGPEVRSIKKGDILITTPLLAKGAIPIMKDKFLMLRERDFVAIW